MSLEKLNQIAKSNPVVKAMLYPAIVTRRAFLKRKHALQMEVIKNFSQMACEDPVVKLTEFQGVFAMDPRSHLFSRTMISGGYETKLLQMVAPYIDHQRDALDVGANIGFYTVMLAKTLATRKVLAVEPTQNALRRLRRNIELNGVGGNVEIFEGVASSTVGTTEISVVEGKEEYSSLGKMKHHSIEGEQSRVETVASTTLDALVAEKAIDPGFVKVDVEGVEHLVFQGAQAVLSKHRPVILSELSDVLLKENGSSSIEVINMIKQHDYDVVDPLNPSVPPGKIRYGDLLCFPKEMNIRWEARSADSSKPSIFTRN